MKITDLVQPKDFFRELVEQAAKDTSTKPTPLASEYLVGLLEYYINTDHLYAYKNNDGRRSMSTLAEMWLNAGIVDSHQRVELLKRLGDTSLYVCGFFSESLKRKVVDVDYYVEMGGSAYRSLAGYNHGKSISEVYEEFSQRFSDFAEMLFVISQKARMSMPGDLINMFDQVIARDSASAKQELAKHGIFAPSTLKKTNQ
jgi:hypothetical protein